MHYTGVSILVMLAATVQAFVIPPGTADGEYMVRRNADGIDEHVPVVRSLEPVSPAAEKFRFAKRDGFTWCGCGLRMVSGDCDAAVQNVKDQTRGGTITIQAGQSYYAIRGKAVAFICNNVNGGGNKPHQTNAGIFAAVLRGITDTCGSYVPGATFNGDDSLFHGYQIWTPGTDFCGNVQKGTYVPTGQHC